MPDHQHWLDRWHENRIGFHESGVNQHLQNYLGSFKLEPGASLFLPLCGKANDIAWLAGQGFEVFGIEISALAIESFFSENELQYQTFSNDRFVLYKSGPINLLQGDFFDLQAEDISDCSLIYDRAALIAMDQSQRPDYYRHMASIAPADSEMLLITLEYDQNEMAGPPFTVPESEVREHYSEYSIELLEKNNIIDERPRWRKVGLTALSDAVFRLGSVAR